MQQYSRGTLRKVYFCVYEFGISRIFGPGEHIWSRLRCNLLIMSYIIILYSNQIPSGTHLQLSGVLSGDLNSQTYDYLSNFLTGVLGSDVLGYIVRLHVNLP